LEPRYRALVLVGGYTGLRIGEATHLRPDHLNLLRRQLRVVEHLKTEASLRTVSLPRFLVEELAQHLGKYRGEYVFIAPEGGQVRPQNFRRRAWRPVAPEGVRFHDLRHSHAAMLIAAGVHPKVIQERLGHTSIKTTLDIYGHLYDGLDEAAADTLDDVFERSRVDKMWPSSTGQLAQS
ncbi:MAG: tyrosine-type recombinase/integrase, partial [Acidimicrobiia bacterium]